MCTVEALASVHIFSLGWTSNSTIFTLTSWDIDTPVMSPCSQSYTAFLESSLLRSSVRVAFRLLRVVLGNSCLKKRHHPWYSCNRILMIGLNRFLLLTTSSIGPRLLQSLCDQ